MAIPTNQKLNEVSYLHYYNRQFFTKSFLSIKLDKDGLMPSERALKEVHKFLLKSQQIDEDDMRTDHTLICDVWHGDRAIVVHSQKAAKTLSNMVLTLEPCICKFLIEAKGICVGPKRPIFKQATSAMATYLEEFWKKQGILTNANASFFTLELHKLTCILIQGNEFRVGDLVLVQPDLSGMFHNFIIFLLPFGVSFPSNCFSHNYSHYVRLFSNKLFSCTFYDSSSLRMYEEF